VRSRVQLKTKVSAPCEGHAAMLGQQDLAYRIVTVVKCSVKGFKYFEPARNALEEATGDAKDLSYQNPQLLRLQCILSSHLMYRRTQSRLAAAFLEANHNCTRAAFVRRTCVLFADCRVVPAAQGLKCPSF